MNFAPLFKTDHKNYTLRNQFDFRVIVPFTNSILLDCYRIYHCHYSIYLSVTLSQRYDTYDQLAQKKQLVRNEDPTQSEYAEQSNSNVLLIFKVKERLHITMDGCLEFQLYFWTTS